MLQHNIRHSYCGIDLSAIGSGSILTIADVTTMLRSDGSNFGDNDLDPEGLVYNARRDTLIMSSERDPDGIFEFYIDGKLKMNYNVPDYYLRSASDTFGTRINLGFEGLSVTPDQRYVWAANENALVQDGPRADLDLGSPARFIKFDPSSGYPAGEEYIYYTDPVQDEPVPIDAFKDNGLTEIVTLNNRGYNWLVLERSFSSGSPGRGYNLRSKQQAMVPRMWLVATLCISSLWARP